MLKTKYINIPIFFLVFVLFFIFYSLLTTHYSLVYAQSSDTQKAVETVKEKVETLIEAKDENNLDNLNLKISALKKVIELSISEAKDLRIKILSVDLSEDKTNQKSMSKWLEKVLASLNATISYYEKQTLNLENDDEISDAETIKVLAENLKNWREKNYLPLDNEVRDLLLTIQETKAIAVTKNRAQKINEDVLKFQKNRGKNASLNKLMETAFKSINESEKFNEKAKNLFLETYIYTIANSIISSSTEIFSSTTTEINTEINNNTTTILIAEPAAITAISDSTSTIPQPPTMSIRDLVRESLDKIKETYQIFIEMSNLVRKLLK